MGLYNNVDRRVRRELRLPGVSRPASIIGSSGEFVTVDAAIDYFSLFKRYSVCIVCITALFAGCGFLIALLQTPIYRARTTLEVHSPNEDFMNLKQVDPLGTSGESMESYIETQTKLLRSESLIGRVVDKHRLSERSPLFARSVFSRLLDRNQPLSNVDREQTIAAILGSIDASPDGRSRLVTLTVDTPDPNLSAEIANGIASEYTETALESRWNTTTRTEAWLTQQLEKFRSHLRRSEEELQAYARNAGLLFTNERDSLDEGRLKQIQEEFSRARALRMEKQSQLEQAQNSPIDSLPQILDDVSLRSYKERLTDLQRQIAELRTVYNPAHYKIVRIDKQISEMTQALERERTNIVQRIGNEFEASARRERMLTLEYGQQTKLVSGQAVKSIQYNVLKRDVETNRELYRSMLQKMKEAGIASAMRASSARVVDPAKPAPHPHRPSMPLNVGLASLCGACISVVGALIRERTDRRVQAPGQVALHFGLSEVGVIPSASIDGDVKDLRSRRAKVVLAPSANRRGIEPTLEVASYFRRSSLMAESFRSAVASLLLGGYHGARVVVVTSAEQKDGKTLTIANLSISLAAIGRRVVVIDGDLRRPRLHRIFNVSSQHRLATILTSGRSIREYEIDELASPTPIPNVFVLPSNAGDSEATNLLYSDRLKRLVLRLQAEFDYVLIDAPPLFLSDARALSKLADCALLVCRLGTTSLDRFSMAIKWLSDDGTPLAGAVLNCWTPRSDSTNYYGAYTSYKPDN